MTTHGLIDLIKTQNLSKLQTMSDYFELCRLLEKTESENAYSNAENIYHLCMKYSRIFATSDIEKAVGYFELAKKTALFLSQRYFHYYLLYVEWNRESQKKFYAPRMKVLKRIVNDLQDLEDDKIDFLAISLPPRVGKSTLGIFYITWLMGKYPDKANVMSGHSDKLTEGFYKEVNSIISSGEYLWSDVFPECRIANTSAKNESIDLNTEKRFPTLTCRSISGTLTGAVEVAKLLYVDDIIEDLEEALNPQRLQNKYDAYLNQLKDRKKDKAKELHIGTRWSVSDVIGRIQEQYEGNSRYRFTVIPALDKNDESNFNYPYNLGFSTEYYLDMKNSIDDATWCAKYMGVPYEREGLLFPDDELRYYNGTLPEGKPDMIISACDVAWGGGDDLFMPFGYVYGEDVYIDDLILNNGDKTVTQPIVIGKLAYHKPHRTKFEANNGGSEYADYVDTELRKQGVRINISHEKAPNTKSKMARIIQAAPDIKRFFFRDKEHSTKEYKDALHKLTTFLVSGRNKHDDVPDGFAMLKELIFVGDSETKIFKRFF